MSESRVVGFGEPPAARRRSRRGRGLDMSRALVWSWRLLCGATVLAALALGALHTISLVVVALVVFASAALAMAAPGRMRLPEVT